MQIAGLNAVARVNIDIKLPAITSNAVALNPINAPESAVEIGFNPREANIIRLMMRPVRAGAIRVCNQVISRMLLYPLAAPITDEAIAATSVEGAIPITIKPIPIRLITLNKTVPSRFGEGLGKMPARTIPNSEPPPKNDIINP